MITTQAIAHDLEAAVTQLTDNEPETRSQEYDAGEGENLDEHLDKVLPKAAKKFCLKQAAERLSPALLHVVQQSTEKRRDRALAALIALIYGPTPFGGANTFKEVAVRYSMTEQNLYALMNTHRALLVPKHADQPHDFANNG